MTKPIRLKKGDRVLWKKPVGVVKEYSGQLSVWWKDGSIDYHLEDYKALPGRARK
jgi:hypothetical protein